jgi:GNAT superfamily N-acetyltransferase
MTLSVRDAIAADAEALVAILIASKESSIPQLLDAHDSNFSFWTDRWRRYLTEGSRAQMSQGDGFALFVEIGGRPVGFAAYHHTTRHGAGAELESMYVLKEFQGHGLGARLLRAVGGRLHADGSGSMCVGYDHRNPYKRFYLERGAVEINPHWAVWRDLSLFASEGAP